MCRQALGKAVQGRTIRLGKLRRQLPKVGVIGLRLLYQNILARLAQQRQQVTFLLLKMRFQFTLKSLPASGSGNPNLFVVARGRGALGVQRKLQGAVMLARKILQSLVTFHVSNRPDSGAVPITRHYQYFSKAIWPRIPRRLVAKPNLPNN